MITLGTTWVVWVNGKRERVVLVKFTGSSIWVRRPDGRRESVPWSVFFLDWMAEEVL